MAESLEEATYPPISVAFGKTFTSKGKKKVFLGALVRECPDGLVGGYMVSLGSFFSKMCLPPGHEVSDRSCVVKQRDLP